MTGEISLHGAVLPVGGVAEKVRAARKVGISRVVVPEANQREAREALQDGGKGEKVEVIAVRTVQEAIEACIEGGNPWAAPSERPNPSNYGAGGQQTLLSRAVDAKL